MTLRKWLKENGQFKDSLLDKEILIECPNGLLVTPQIRYKSSSEYGPYIFREDDIEALVISWQ